MNEDDVRSFWAAHPCGDHIVGGLREGFEDDYEEFFRAYDRWRYDQEGHILGLLDRTGWRDRRVLEIGLGQGAESEQLIRRGAQWSGLDLTQESVDRVRTRLDLHGLAYDEVRQGSVLEVPWADDSFDVVFSHGVLHHVPDIGQAQAEIHRVLRPGGTLVVMLYARRSLNYEVSIRLVRRAALLAAYPFRRSARVQRSEMLSQHLANAERLGLGEYLRLNTFTHYNTDGPLNPYARVYSVDEVRQDFRDFEVIESQQAYLHAPPLPIHAIPFGQSLVGWHLWVWMRAR